MTKSPQSDIPVLVETLSRPSIPITRCHYLSIECDEPRPGWNLNLQGPSLPFLMLNLVGIVQRPFNAPSFNTYELIDGLFDFVEDKALLTINFEDIWLPSFLFRSEVTVGDVYRIDQQLFTLAYQYRDGRLSQETFDRLCDELHSQIDYSEEESTAFKGWAAQQFSIARTRAPKNPELRLRSRAGSNEIEN